MNTFKFFLFLLILFVNSFFNIGFSQSEIPKGNIKGRLIDSETNLPLIGANIIVLNTLKGAATDDEGFYRILEVPVGTYTIQFNYIGYETNTKTDVIVKPGRTIFIEADLKPSTLETEAIVVTGGYFNEDEAQPTSIANFSAEEIRRAPGSAGDVSRIIMGLPSIAKVNDQSNSLVVRGGSPVENAFYVDNIEIPNINHFPTQGSSGGPIGIINVDFIKDVNFYSGGFSSAYGDKLSSIMELTFREGNRDEFDAQLDLNFTGFGGVAEGPLFNKKGSWLFSVRRSYLDYLIKAINVGSSVAPIYGDLQGKLVYDLNASNKLTALAVLADDHMKTDINIARENDMIYFGDQDIYENTFGINWRWLWNKKGYSNTSVSYTSTKFKEDFFTTGTGRQLLKNRSFEQVVKLRNVNNTRIDKNNKIEFGFESKFLILDYSNYYAEDTDALGNIIPSFSINKNFRSNKYAAFINYICNPFKQLTTNLGLRADYFDYNQNSHISPRLSLSYKLSDKTSINGSTGIYYQNLPNILLTQNQSNKNLNDPYAIHYVLSLNHLLTENMKLTLEVYQKDYNNFPMDPSQPNLFLIDEIFYHYGFFQNHSHLKNDGKAFARGVELMLQKKLAKDFYGLASASFFRTKYLGDDNSWRNRIFENRYTFSIEGGYKPNYKWEFSLRWIYAGGIPYTPFNIGTSQAINKGVFDENRINESRYPDYHSLNIRFDRRFHFSSSNIIFYFSIWNAYNHKNVASYYWNEYENKQDTIYQWSMLPIFGVEYEF